MSKKAITYLSVPEVAKRLGVHRNTVLYWGKRGILEMVKKNPFVTRPQNMIPEYEVERLEKAREDEHILA